MDLCRIIADADVEGDFTVQLSASDFAITSYYNGKTVDEKWLIWLNRLLI